MSEEEKSGEEEKPVLSGFEERMRRIQNGERLPELVGRPITDAQYLSIYGIRKPTPNGGRRIRRKQTKRRRSTKRRRGSKRRK
jgi:hypothetical protein